MLKYIVYTKIVQEGICISIIRWPMGYRYLFSILDMKQVINCVCVCDFQPCLSHGTHKLITKILWHTKNIFLANLTKNRYNFDSFTLNNYYCVVCYHFFIWQSKGKEVSCPWLNSQVQHVLKILGSTPVENRWARKWV